LDKIVTEKIDRYIERVKQYIPLKMAVLYGSFARGTEKEYSDIDIAVIADKVDGNEIEVEYNLFKLRRDIDDRIEPVLLSAAGDKSGFLDSILKYGKVLYRR
jgi:predicted nucleotidyltransferase